MLLSFRVIVIPSGSVMGLPVWSRIRVSLKSPMIFVVFSMFSLLVFFYGCAVVE